MENAVSTLLEILVVLEQPLNHRHETCVSTLLEILETALKTARGGVVSVFQPFLRFWVERPARHYVNVPFVSTLLEILVGQLVATSGDGGIVFQPFLRFWREKDVPT